MIILQSVKMALKSIMSNKLRSFLTMLGIIIGVFALVVLVSLVSGATSSITDSITGLGTDKVDVYISSQTAHPFRMEDLEILEGYDSITAAAPSTESALQASTIRKTGGVYVIGTTPSYREIQQLNLKYGRFVMTPDMDNSTNVIIVSYEMAIDFVGRPNCVGETIALNGKTFRIVGVLEKATAADMLFGTSMMMQYMAYIPYSSSLRIFPDVTQDKRITRFCASAPSDRISEAADDIGEYLRRLFGSEDEYWILSNSEISDAIGEVTATLSLLLGGIAAISLLVGGIGIMNIMLVSVTERTREIGIRKAIGAASSVILFQFLIEAMTLSLVGCLMGIGLSWLAMLVINILGNVSFGLSFTVVIVAVSFSMGVGILFGLYPAKRAASMKPIDALRFS